MARTTNQAGMELIKEFEGVVPKAYLDPVGILTVGVGHVVLPKDNIKLGQVISGQRVDILLREDLSKAGQGVENALTEDVTDNQFAACVSLAFNIGVSAFRKSSIVKFINAGDVLLAADRFLLYNKAKGKTLAGLTRRRKAERALFLTEDDIEQAPEAAPIKNGVEAAETTSEKIITTTTTETPNATVEKKSIVSTIAEHATVKEVASAGVSKLGNRVATGLATGSATSVLSGFFERNMGLIIFGCVLIVLAAAIVGGVMWHRSTKEKKLADISSDKQKDDVIFVEKQHGT